MSSAAPGTRVAFAGLGAMGWPMAARLVGAGFDLVGVDAQPGRAERFAAEVGGSAAADAAEVARGVTVAYVTFFRGTPLFVQILLVHFALMPALIHPDTGLLLSGDAARTFRQEHGAFFSGSLALTLVLLLAVGVAALVAGRRAPRGERVPGRWWILAAGAVLGVLLWHVAGEIGGDGLFHLARARKLDAFGSL